MITFAQTRCVNIYPCRNPTAVHLAIIEIELWVNRYMQYHYNDVIMGTMSYEITSVPFVYSTACSGASQRKYQNSASLAFVRGNYRWPVNSPHKGYLTRKMFPSDDVIMQNFSVCWLIPALIFDELIQIYISIECWCGLPDMTISRSEPFVT